MGFFGDPSFDVVFAEGFVPPSPSFPNDVTNVGLLSLYGTAGQGGNVAELMESTNDNMNNNPTRSRIWRGGYWLNPLGLISGSRASLPPGGEGGNIGFRIASRIPEPSSLLLAAMAAVGLLVRLPK